MGSCLRFSVIVVVVCTAAFATDAGAAMVVTYDSTGWSTTDPAVVVKNGPATAVTSERDVRAGRDNAQTFELASPITLDRIWVHYRDLTVGQPFTLQLFSVADATSGTYPTPPLDVSSQPVYLVNEPHTVPTGAPDTQTVTGPSAFISFDVDDVALPAGDYALRFDTDQSNPSSFRFKWLTTASNSYALGRYYEDPADGDSSTTETNDRAFAIQAVPEPGSACALALACASLLGRRPRRR